jgi:hypothetical protein
VCRPAAGTRAAFNSQDFGTSHWQLMIDGYTSFTRIQKGAAMAGAVKLFGRLQDHPILTRQQQAFEKRQWTKSREVERLPCGGPYKGLIELRTLMRTDRASRDQVDGAFKRVMPLPF